MCVLLLSALTGCPADGPSGFASVTDPSSTSTATTGQDVPDDAPTTHAPGSTSDPTSGGDPATTTTTTSDPSTTTTTGATTTTTTGGATTTTGGATQPQPVACDGKIWQCGDGIDNDGDGAIDGGDKECTSPCDDREDSLQTALPGQAKDCKNDCFWDPESGVGNDGCEFALQCDAMNPGAQIGCEFKQACEATITDKCLDVCVPLIPNGCDCFGCCHIDTPDGVLDIYLASSPACSFSNLGACEQCTFQEGCQNPCDADACEVCFGQDAPPDGCGGPKCDPGVDACTVDKNGVHDCDDGYFCATGCCYPIVPG